MTRHGASISAAPLTRIMASERGETVRICPSSCTCTTGPCLIIVPASVTTAIRFNRVRRAGRVRVDDHLRRGRVIGRVGIPYSHSRTSRRWRTSARA